MFTYMEWKNKGKLQAQTIYSSFHERMHNTKHVSCTIVVSQFACNMLDMYTWHIQWLNQAVMIQSVLFNYFKMAHYQF